MDDDDEDEEEKGEMKDGGKSAGNNVTWGALGQLLMDGIMERGLRPG